MSTPWRCIKNQHSDRCMCCLWWNGLSVFQAASSKLKPISMSQFEHESMHWQSGVARNISTEEMYHYHGILLKMILDHHTIGGYRLYLLPPSKLIVSANYTIDLVDYPAWAAKHMMLGRFKQIRGAFHLEVGVSPIDDKCHQLWYAINVLKSAARIAFVPGHNICFDEGGIPSWSWFNPDCILPQHVSKQSPMTQILATVYTICCHCCCKYWCNVTASWG